MPIPILFAFVALTLGATLGAGYGAGPILRSEDEPLDRLRDLYLAAVEHEEAVAAGLDEVEKIRRTVQPPPESSLRWTLRAYEGALVTLRAKHGFWPTARLRHLQNGLSILDEVVLRAPDNAEARYLRLMSCYYLPGILGRGSTVREDFQALARLLPDVRSEYSPDLFDSIARFVLGHGDLQPQDAARLAAALHDAEG